MKISSCGRVKGVWVFIERPSSALMLLPYTFEHFLTFLIPPYKFFGFKRAKTSKKIFQTVF